jgi:hypothetical protein
VRQFLNPKLLFCKTVLCLIIQKNIFQDCIIKNKKIGEATKLPQALPLTERSEKA